MRCPTCNAEDSYEPKISDVEPIGKRSSVALVRYGFGCKMEEVTQSVYPDSPASSELREFRIRLGMSLGDAARTLGIKASRMSDLEHGRAAFSDPQDYQRAKDALRKASP